MLLGFIPDSIIVAGLFGCVLALIIATAQQKWELKVLFLLALRLAIGWQFFFEGLHKINTHLVGVTETNKPFSSEPYFKVAPTAMGEIMRGKFDDPRKFIEDRVKAPEKIELPAFKGMPQSERAAYCPAVVAKEMDDLAELVSKATLESAKEDLESAGRRRDKAVAEAKDDAAKKKDAEDHYAADAANLNAIIADPLKAAQMKIQEAKAKYASWVHGSAPRNAKLKQINDPAPYSAPQWLAAIAADKARIEKELKESDEKRSFGLGKTTPAEVKRTTELRNDLLALDADLAKEAKDFHNELVKDTLGLKNPPKDTTVSEGKRIDQFTMWFICVVGAAIFFGFCTRISCVLAAFFLVMTYLTHPPFPWYTLPPGTEGNPLFVNKNAIECLALLVLACYPTGRWLGLDALLHRLFARKHPPAVQTR